MSQPDLKHIEENYANMPDWEIERIALTNSTGLRTEVFKILENEIKKRNLNPELLKAVIAKNKDYTVAEIENYSQIIRQLPCPICGDTREKLNGTIFYEVKSFVIFTTYSAKLAIACPTCLNKKNDEAIFSTALLGWWGIPWGLIRTPRYIYKNIKAKKQNNVENPNAILMSFTLEKIGEIEVYKDNPQKLSELLVNNNKK